MTKSIFSLIVVLLGICLPSWGAERLRVATEGAYPPFNFLDEQGRPAGFDVEIARAICAELKTECEIVAVPWDRILTDLTDGKYDMIVASMSETPERTKLAEFSISYCRTLSAFLGRPTVGIREVSPETVRGKVLASQVDTIQAAYLQSHYKDVAVLKFTATMPEAFDALVKGEADYVLADNLIIYSFMRSDAGQPFKVIGEPLSDGEVSSLSHIQVRKGNLKLLDAVNKALHDIRLNGVYQAINAKYFPFDIY